ncbi:hypothetical protein [Sphingopyxis sp.]|uniref:hypothetical protein n=1 Tax=Sphingopyxis sp. TaxID=1908224 RepID=UPI003D6C726F
MVTTLFTSMANAIMRARARKPLSQRISGNLAACLNITVSNDPAQDLHDDHRGSCAINATNISDDSITGPIDLAEDLDFGDDQGGRRDATMLRRLAENHAKSVETVENPWRNLRPSTETAPSLKIGAPDMNMMGTQIIGKLP